MTDGDVTTQLLRQRQRVLKDLDRDKGQSKGKPRLNIASAIVPVRHVSANGKEEPVADKAVQTRCKAATGGEGHDKLFTGDTASSANPLPSSTGPKGDAVAHYVDSSGSGRSTSHPPTASGGGHVRYRITDTGSLHILGDEDNRVLITVKDEVSVPEAEGGHRHDKDKPKKYLHITEHKRNPNRRIEYKHLDVPHDNNGVLGQGTQGIVKKVYHRPSDTYFAMKILNTEGADSRQLVAELEHLLASVRQKHCRHLVTSYEAFFRSTKLCILMELMEYGSLADVLKKTRLEEAEARVMAHHVLQGLEVLQGWGVVHRDIKPGNLLINQKGIAKIADFGVATFVNSLNLANSAHGTRIYMAPERMDLKEYSYQADIWSFGLCVAQAVCGDLLQWLNTAPEGDGRSASPQRGPHSFARSRFFDCAVAIAAKCFQVFLPATLRLSAALQDFVHSCLRQEWERRPLAAELLQHGFLAPLTGGAESLGEYTLEATLLRRIDAVKVTQPSAPIVDLPHASSAASLPSLPPTPVALKPSSSPIPSSASPTSFPDGMSLAESLGPLRQCPTTSFFPSSGGPGDFALTASASDAAASVASLASSNGSLSVAQRDDSSNSPDTLPGDTNPLTPSKGP